MNPAPSDVRSTLANCGWLTVFALAGWLLLLGPAHLLGERDGVEGVTWAAALCLVPGWLVFLVSSRFHGLNAQLPVVVIGGTVLRMMFVLVGMVAVQGSRPDLGFREFTLWLLVFYLGMLAAETSLTLKAHSEEGATGESGSAATQTTEVPASEAN